METTFANRLISARKMAGLSLQSLSDKLGNVVSKQSLNKYEQGKMKPDSELIIAISNILHVPVNYFYTTPSFEVKFENIDFRRFSSRLSVTDEESVKEKAKDMFERYFELESILNMDEDYQYFEYPIPITNTEEAGKAAQKLRKDWDLGYDSIADVVEMLEDKGYKVVEVEADESFDGFKADVRNKKVIVLRQTKDEDDVVRKRFTALHELAHHILKFPGEINEKEKERLCHVFACALLYPEEMARKEMHKERFHFYLNELELIKSRWGISFPAIFNRALHLGIISPPVYKKLNIGYRSRHYHLPNSEPGVYLGKEKPVRMERMVYLGLGKDILTINEAAYYSGMSSWRLRSKINQLV